MRLKGKTYMEIMNAGGGIHATTRATKSATHEELYEQSEERLNKFLQHGVTTVEAKSRYGMSWEGELKKLEVSTQLQNNHPIDIASTFMGAHALPLEQKENLEGFVKQVIEVMTTQVA